MTRAAFPELVHAVRRKPAQEVRAILIRILFASSGVAGGILLLVVIIGKPMLILVGNIADGATRRPGVEWYHTATDVAQIVRGYVKYDAQPLSLQSFGEEIMKATSLALTPVQEPTLITVDADLA